MKKVSRKQFEEIASKRSASLIKDAYDGYMKKERKDFSEEAVFELFGILVDFAVCLIDGIGREIFDSEEERKETQEEKRSDRIC